MKIEVNIEKKYAYLILSVVILSAGLLIVTAYNSPGVPATFGHSVNEIDWSQTIPSVKVNNLEVIETFQVNGQSLVNTCPPGYSWVKNPTEAHCENSTLGNAPLNTTCAYSGKTITLLNQGLFSEGGAHVLYSGSTSEMVSCGWCGYMYQMGSSIISCTRNWYGGSTWSSCSCNLITDCPECDTGD